MLSENSKNCLGRLPAGVTFTVSATYVGNAPDAALVYELYGTHTEAEAADRPIAAILPMTTGVLIQQLQLAQLTGRCQIGPHQGFVAERLVVESAADWVVSSIMVGRSSQFAQLGDVPGLAFGPGTMGSAVSFDVARARIDVSLQTTYIGPRESSSFVCGILGSLVDLTETAPSLSPRRGHAQLVRDSRV